MNVLYSPPTTSYRTLSASYSSTNFKIDGAKIKRIKDEQERAERESYDRQTSEWTRVGHYRTLRNGEKKWIKPTTCYAKENVGEKKPKLYKLK